MLRTLICLFLLVLSTSSNHTFAATVDLTPTADGDVQTFGGDDVDVVDSVLAFTQSGGLQRHVILEFNLSAIADGSVITDARVDFTLTRFVSQVGSDDAAIDIIAYNGDGVVNISDFAAEGSQVVDTVTASGGSSGDVRSFTFADTTPISDALAGNLLTLRIETDSFASINIAALENLTLDAVNLSIEFTPVPLPAAFVLMLTGSALLGVGGRLTRRA